MEKVDLGVARKLETVGDRRGVVKACRAVGQKLEEALTEAIGSLATSLAAITRIDNTRGADVAELQEIG